jgi:hypothetical protein
LSNQPTQQQVNQQQQQLQEQARRDRQRQTELREQEQARQRNIARSPECPGRVIENVEATQSWKIINPNKCDFSFEESKRSPAALLI